MKLQAEMKAKGFVIDTCCYPHVAYKGPRFAPTEVHECFTELEERMLIALEGAHEIIEGLQTGKIWSRHNIDVIRARRLAAETIRRAKGAL